MAHRHSTINVLSLKARTLAFLSCLILVSFFGLLQINRSQDHLAKTSGQIRQVLLPAGRLFEEAKGELELQAQELALLSQSKGKTAVNFQDMGLLRLGPAVKSLSQLHESPLMPHAVGPLMDPWMKSVNEYNEKLGDTRDLSLAITQLKALKQKTELLQRAVDRELSVQLLQLSESIHSSAVIWSIALCLASLATLAFTILLWMWMSPLEKMRDWLKQYCNIDGVYSFLEAPPPPSVLGSGVLSPPREVQELVEALRFHLTTFKDLARALKTKSEKNNETEKAMGTLFAGFQYLLRNNQELLNELIQKERLASMGEMAAHLAHEIRNPLNSLNLKMELLREDLPDAQKNQIDRVLGEIDRLNALTESHLLMTKQKISQKAPSLPIGLTTPNDTTQLLTSIDTVIDLLKPAAQEKNISLEFNQQSSPIALSAALPDSVLRASLINVIKNAIEACEDSAIRKILVAVEGNSAELKISVHDTGSGFSEDWLKNPFQIFRSAKPQGTGIGLHASKKMLGDFGYSIHINHDIKTGFTTCVSLSGPSAKQGNIQNQVSTSKASTLV